MTYRHEPKVAPLLLAKPGHVAELWDQQDRLIHGLLAGAWTSPHTGEEEGTNLRRYRECACVFFQVQKSKNSPRPV